MRITFFQIHIIFVYFACKKRLKRSHISPIIFETSLLNQSGIKLNIIFCDLPRFRFRTFKKIGSYHSKKYLKSSWLTNSQIKISQLMKLLIFVVLQFSKLFLICFMIAQLQNYYKISWKGVTHSQLVQLSEVKI